MVLGVEVGGICGCGAVLYQRLIDVIAIGIPVTQALGLAVVAVFTQHLPVSVVVIVGIGIGDVISL